MVDTCPGYLLPIRDMGLISNTLSFRCPFHVYLLVFRCGMPKKYAYWLKQSCMWLEDIKTTEVSLWPRVALCRGAHPPQGKESKSPPPIHFVLHLLYRPVWGVWNMGVRFSSSGILFENLVSKAAF